MVNGKEFIDSLKERFASEEGPGFGEAALAKRLGVTRVTLANWRNQRSVSVRQMVGLIARIEKATRMRAEGSAVRPIVEFLRLDACESAKGAKQEIFSAKDDEGTQHPYLAGLRRELDEHRGIYIFYDSRGRALYVGRTKEQSLWAEINLAFNRDRSVQKIRRVAHPSRKQEFRTSDEKRRQISQATVPLHDIASYLSAYEVADGLISNMESLLIRGFANDILNVRMETLTWETRRRTKAS
jgi:transcriptional regulator with XRE-family HTH domain